MGKRGRKRTPTALARARGNPGHRPLNDEEPQYEVAESTPPKGLKGVALALWKTHAPELITTGVLKAVAVPLFAELCKIADEIAEWDRLITKVGLDAAKTLRYTAERARARTLFKGYYSELGLSPTSSAGVRARHSRREAPPAVDQPAQRRRRFFGVIDGGQQKKA